MDYLKGNIIKKYGTEAGKRVMLWGITLLCWWGMFMPGLLANEGTVRIYRNGEEYRAETDVKRLYWEMICAEEDEVVFKSRFMEYLREKGLVEE